MSSGIRESSEQPKQRLGECRHLGLGGRPDLAEVGPELAPFSDGQVAGTRGRLLVSALEEIGGE